MLLLISYAAAATLSVGPTATYKTITDAVKASANGDIILVAPGTYAESPDLRNKAITVVSASGPAVTTINATNTVYVDASTLQGFTINTTAATGVGVYGNATLKELVLNNATNYGVAIVSGTANVQEVMTVDTAMYGFVVTGGSATFRHCISLNSGQIGISMQSTSASSVQNSLSIGGLYGIRTLKATTPLSQVVVVGATKNALAIGSTTTVVNSVFQDNSVVVQCYNASVTFTNGIGWANNSATACDASTLSTVTTADPMFSSWSASYDFYDLDFSPRAGSPMIDKGSGKDADNTVADYGLFGGAYGVWPDQDSDGVPVLFDCDDHLAATYPGAPEIGDQHDNDCNGQIDDGVIIDTGDSGDTADTGDSGPQDTQTPSTTDLDGDGYSADVDCDEHNIATHPNATEIPDHADNDCDVLIDEGTYLGDDDGDGYSESLGDCDDNDPSRYPGGVDSQNDGVDNDCSGADNNAQGVKDRDGDGYVDTSDCNDTDAAVHPGIADPMNGKDDDCDGLVDEDGLNVDKDKDGYTVADGDCNDGNSSIYGGAVDTPDDFIDQDCTGSDNFDVDRDGDPAPASGGGDCDDHNSTLSSLMEEVCGNNADEDCDGADIACDDVQKVGATACGCATTGNTSWAVGLMALAILGRRRR